MRRGIKKDRCGIEKTGTEKLATGPGNPGPVKRLKAMQAVKTARALVSDRKHPVEDAGDDHADRDGQHPSHDDVADNP